MASSSKVQFKLDTLKARALETIDLRIAQKQEELDRLGSAEDQAQRTRDWRKAQEAKLRKLFRELDEMPDNVLAQFQVDKIPSVDRWDRDRVKQVLARLQVERTEIIAKAESLVPDEAGNISLTKTQLREFFEL